MTSDLQDMPAGFNPMKPNTTDSDGRSVRCEFRYLNKADQLDAMCVASWLRQLADDVEDEEYRSKCSDIFTAGFCRPLSHEFLTTDGTHKGAM